MAQLNEILSFVDELLASDRFEDYGPNGLQVPGVEQIERVVTAVSAQLELFERAVSQQAQLIFVHHGILWNSMPRRVDRVLARRLKVLLTNGISLAAYHLPLDAHPEIGNNALIAEGIGAKIHGSFASHKGSDIGVIAKFPRPGITAEELFNRTETLTGRNPLMFPFGRPQIETVGVVSGGAASSLAEAVSLQLDAFITGEPSEPAMAEAKEAGIHFIAAGHYATETFGIRKLGELVAERFEVQHEFIDIPNPV